MLNECYEIGLHSLKNYYQNWSQSLFFRIFIGFFLQCFRTIFPMYYQFNVGCRVINQDTVPVFFFNPSSLYVLLTGVVQLFNLHLTLHIVKQFFKMSFASLFCFKCEIFDLEPNFKRKQKHEPCLQNKEMNALYLF